MFSQDDGTVTRFIFLSNGKILKSNNLETLEIRAFEEARRPVVPTLCLTGWGK